MAIIMKYDKPTALRIRNFLIKQGLTIEGAYGMMANIYCESGFRANNAQNSCMTRLGMTDEIYAAKVDSGEYKNFTTDRVGWGLCQWTSSGRKTSLLTYAKEQKKSIADETMQLNYLMKELKTSYKAIFNMLTTSHDISECAKYVMTKFERPANQSDENQNKRASYGIQLFNDLEEKKRSDNIMGYTNSPLVTYTKISPNKTSPRNHIIDTITIHCMAGNLTVETCGNIFAKTSRKASSNYGIGTDGRIAMYVEEKDRSWCSSNSANDHRAITIEVANDGGAPDWHVSDKAMESLIKLVADICKRNNIKELKWSTNKSDRVNHRNGCNMTVHRDFAAKACPGAYLYEKHGYIADEVNKILGTYTTSTTTRSYLMKGDTGEEVKVLQENLNYIGYSCGKADGNFGTKTETALMKFQGSYNLTVDGKYGSVSKKTLENAVAKKKASYNTTSKFVYKSVDYSPVFDPTFYANEYSDLKSAFGTNVSKLWNHFTTHGMVEGRQAHAKFNVNIYKNRYDDLQKAFGSNLPAYYQHYCQFGEKEGRSAV